MIALLSEAVLLFSNINWFQGKLSLQVIVLINKNFWDVSIYIWHGRWWQFFK